MPCCWPLTLKLAESSGLADACFRSSATDALMPSSQADGSCPAALGLVRGSRSSPYEPRSDDRVGAEVSYMIAVLP